MKLSLGNNIRENRRRMNLTQEQLADEFGTSPQAISRWENGTTYPDIEMLPMIASFFGTSVDAMLGCTDEEKKKFCDELTREFETAVRAKDTAKAIEIMREIRRNLREYHSYCYWGLFHEIWRARLFKEDGVLEEMRMFADVIFADVNFDICPRDEHFSMIEQMAEMEDDEHIHTFLDEHSTDWDMSRKNLLFKRYKMREELDKIEPVRQYLLWDELSSITTSTNDWQEYLCQDAAHWKWYSKVQLDYLNAVNCLEPDRQHIVSGFDGVDMWCFERLCLGMRYSVALAKLGETDEAYDVFEDFVSLFERVMAIPDEDEFELGCSSPALKTFTLKSKFEWFIESDGLLHRELGMQADNGDGWNWIMPPHYIRDAENDDWFREMRENPRFDTLFARLRACDITREKTE